jgi:hypothetical protein
VNEITAKKLQKLLIDASDPAPRAGLEEVYVALDAAIDAAAALVTLAQAVLPDDLSVDAFVALQELAHLKQAVNPGPSEKEPF